MDRRKRPLWERVAADRDDVVHAVRAIRTSYPGFPRAGDAEGDGEAEAGEAGAGEDGAALGVSEGAGVAVGGGVARSARIATAQAGSGRTATPL